MFIGVALNLYARGAISSYTTVMVTGILCFASGLLLHLYIPSLLTPIWPSYIAAIIIFALAQRYNASLWSWRPIRFLADVSYPLYASHSLIGFCLLTLLIREANIPIGLSLVISTASVLSIAYLLHLLIEEPTRKFGKALASSK